MSGRTLQRVVDFDTVTPEKGVQVPPAASSAEPHGCVNLNMFEPENQILTKDKNIARESLNRSELKEESRVKPQGKTHDNKLLTPALNQTQFLPAKFKPIPTTPAHEPKERNEWQAAASNDSTPYVTNNNEEKRTESNHQLNPTTPENETRKIRTLTNENQKTLKKEKEESPSIP